jgi:hypothetical protein
MYSIAHVVLFFSSLLFVCCNKVIDLVDTLRLRMEELSLPSFVRRVIDLHPWVKQRMQKEANQMKMTSSSSSSLSSTGGGGGGGGGVGSQEQKSYGDLGAALIHEAEVFTKTHHTAPMPPRSNNCVGQAGTDDDNDDDPAVLERVHKVLKTF